MSLQSVSAPLTELGQREYVRPEEGPTGFTGGLYPNGSNSRPPAHEAAGLAIARQIVPLDASGQADSSGKIVMISVGMSNTSSEFGAFQQRVHKNPLINPRLLLVNGAQGGRTADRWRESDAETWQELDNQLARANVTPQQVQVAWIKQTLTRGGDFPEKALALQQDLESIVRNLTLRYPNLKIAYVSSRTRSYTYRRGLSPEPVAFETGFAVKWMIEKQIEGDPALNFDPAKGEVVAPFLAWGPYLWIDGMTPRTDGLVWTQEDLTTDCTHPTQSGNRKVADMLFTFFTTDTTATPWFLAQPESSALANVSSSASPTPAIAGTTAVHIEQRPVPSSLSLRPFLTVMRTAVESRVVFLAVALAVLALTILSFAISWTIYRWR